MEFPKDSRLFQWDTQPLDIGQGNNYSFNRSFHIVLRFSIRGYESLDELNQIMTNIEAPLLNEEMHFKTKYVSIMLSWIMNDLDHSIFTDYGCHCNLNSISRPKPFVGYAKSDTGAKDEIDWFCAQHSTCQACLDKADTSCDPHMTGYRFELGYRNDEKIIRCTGLEINGNQCEVLST